VLALYGRSVPQEASVVFVGAARMRSLNRGFRGKDRVTDVLSFGLGEIVEGRWHAGDVVICLPRARAQAVRAGHSLAREALLLAVHGTLHLLGFRHHGVSPDPMRRAEREVLRAWCPGGRERSRGLRP
jgi:probable rRNA maturation factor